MNDTEQLLGFANAMIDGTASSADVERLSTLLRNRPELQDVYLRYLDTHAALCWQFRDQVEATSVHSQPKPNNFKRKSLLATVLPWLVTTVAMVVATVAVLRLGESRTIHSSNVLLPNPALAEGGIVALIVDEFGAEFVPGRGPNGVRLGRGLYELQKGIVNLRFTQGADVILVAPAQIDIQDNQHIRLVYGKVRVTAPPTAKGFTLATREVDYVDLGTEFGLSVDRQSGTSDLYVFDGQVNVASPKSGQVLSEVTSGKSSRYLDGRLQTAPEIKEADFPIPGLIGLKRWERYELEMRKDPSLLTFFPFRRSENETLLENGLPQKTVANGRIVGARWTTGRWPGKDALLFDRDTDCVQIDIPGEYQELTIAAWLKVDRLDFVLNAILNSDGYEPGGIHFQLNRQGFPRGGVIIAGNFQDQIIGKPVRLGDWVHVASVLSTKTCSQQIYVNGALTRERHWQGEKVLRPGACRLGNWLPTPKDSFTNRALRGRIDELAIWSRTLPKEEMERLVEAGRPTHLWSEK